MCCEDESVNITWNTGAQGGSAAQGGGWTFGGAGQAGDAQGNGWTPGGAGQSGSAFGMQLTTEGVDPTKLSGGNKQPLYG